MLYHINAMIWLIVAVVMFTAPSFRDLELGTTGIAMAWVPLLFVAYNEIRWLMTRQRRPRWPPSAEPPPRRADEYHPEFDFDKPEQEPK